MKLWLFIPCFCLALSFIDIIYSKPLHYHSIFNFGDSLSDTGNYLLSGTEPFPVIGKLPYGQTFFRKPTGRCSDGRLAIDFIAEASGLPYLPPYLGLDKDSGVRQGVNFAVAGASALDVKAWTNYSLNVQLGWFKKFKSSVCSTKQECDNYFRKSLFVVGEIGENDFNYAFFDDKSFEQVQDMVPLVIEEITKAISTLIEDGAVELVVPGIMPMGCQAKFLAQFRSSNKADYDPTNGCLTAFNVFSRFYNKQLQLALQSLRQKHPHARIMYADYYGAYLSLVTSAPQSGYIQETKVACCGGGGPYNFNDSVWCGQDGFTVCKNPSTYANWDGLHFTEAAYKFLAAALIHGSYTMPRLNPYLRSSSESGAYSF